MLTVSQLTQSFTDAPASAARQQECKRDRTHMGMNIFSHRSLFFSFAYGTEESEERGLTLRHPQKISI